MKFVVATITILLGLQSLRADEPAKTEKPELITGKIWMRSYDFKEAEKEMEYALYIPEGYDAKKSYPLMAAVGPERAIGGVTCAMSQQADDTTCPMSFTFARRDLPSCRLEVARRNQGKDHSPNGSILARSLIKHSVPIGRPLAFRLDTTATCISICSVGSFESIYHPGAA